MSGVGDIDSSMSALIPYAVSLEDLIFQISSEGLLACNSQLVDQALDGAPAQKLRELVKVEARRKISAFPTSSPLRARTLGFELPGGIIVDPTSGLGDLLLAATMSMSLSATVEETLSEWSRRLDGTDVSEEFVLLSKLRLVLAAIARHGHGLLNPSNWAQYFHNIRVGDALSSETCSRAALVLLNPPFHLVEAPAGCIWGRGKVSAAAVFLDHVASTSKPDTQVVAIVPDVLRSGSRYAKWREHIQCAMELTSVDVYGLFDTFTDVDVAILRLVRRDTARTNNLWFPVGTGTLLSKIATVTVGPVVPHRDEQPGPLRPFISARTISGCNEFDCSLAPRKGYLSRLESPPFIAVRRTSRPDDKARIIPTVITGAEPVLVENHILVVRPKEPIEISIQKLIEILCRDESTVWLNQRLRCRHLTVKALLDLPIRSEGDLG